MSKKKGLVLGGGGSKGSYEVGVLKALHEMGKMFDVITGTSIGALCGAAVTAGELSGLEDWVGSFKQNMVAKNMFVFPEQYAIPFEVEPEVNTFLKAFTENGPSIEPLKEGYSKIFDFDSFMASNIDFACVAYNVSQGAEADFYKKEMTREDILDKLLASAAYFPAFNLVSIKEDFYLDGGYCNTVPVDIAKKLGAEEIVAVDLSNPDVNVKGLSDCEKVIKPILQLKYYLDFDGPSLVKQVKQGYLETLKYYSKAPGYLYTFYPDDWEHMVILENIALEVLKLAGKEKLLTELSSVLDRIYRFFLGYVPIALENNYSDQYVFGRIIEILGLVAGIDLYEQIHFRDFVREVLKKFDAFDTNPNDVSPDKMVEAMEMKGLRDFMVFFHQALTVFHHRLPDKLKVFEMGEYILPYYLAWGWIVIDKFRLAFIL